MQVATYNKKWYYRPCDNRAMAISETNQPENFILLLIFSEGKLKCFGWCKYVIAASATCFDTMVIHVTHVACLIVVLNNMVMCTNLIN